MLMKMSLRRMTAAGKRSRASSRIAGLYVISADPAEIQLHPVQNVVDDSGGVPAAHLAFRPDNQAVRDRETRHLLHVVRAHKVASADGGQRLRRLVKGQRATRASAHGDLRMPAAGRYDVDDIPLQRWVDMHSGDELIESGKLGCIDHRPERVNGMIPVKGTQHADLFVLGRIAERHLYQET